MWCVREKVRLKCCQCVRFLTISQPSFLFFSEALFSAKKIYINKKIKKCIVHCIDSIGNKFKRGWYICVVSAYWETREGHGDICWAGTREVCDFVLNWVHAPCQGRCLSGNNVKGEGDTSLGFPLRGSGRKERKWIGGAHVWLLSVTGGPLQWLWSVLLFLFLFFVCLFLFRLLLFFFFWIGLG